MNRYRLVVLALVSMSALRSDEPLRPDRRSTDESKKIARDLDLLTASLMHDRLRVICKNAPLAVSYDGPLHRTMRPGGLQVIEGDIDGINRWNVAEVDLFGKSSILILFSIEITLIKMPDTIATCSVNQRQFYVRASRFAKGYTLESKVPGRTITIRELLNLLHDKTGDK